MKYNIFDYDDLPESIQSLAFDELNERFKEYEDSISKDQDEIIEEKKKKDKQEIIFLLIKFILLIISIALAPIIVSSIISFNIAYIVVFTLLCIVGIMIYYLIKTSVYKGYKQDKIEMRGDRAEMSDFPLYLNTVAGGLDRRDQTIGGFSFVVKIYAVPVVEIIG